MPYVRPLLNVWVHMSGCTWTHMNPLKCIWTFDRSTVQNSELMFAKGDSWIVLIKSLCTGPPEANYEWSSHALLKKVYTVHLISTVHDVTVRSFWGGGGTKPPNFKSGYHLGAKLAKCTLWSMDSFPWDDLYDQNTQRHCLTTSFVASLGCRYSPRY